MIIIIGTSHISPESLKVIRNTIKNEKPDCVAVELDPSRYVALIRKTGSRPPGIFLKILAWFQKELGKLTGISPGREMMKAIEVSKKEKIPVYLIDQNFLITVKELQEISFFEKLKLLCAIFLSIGSNEVDLRKVPPKKVVKDAIKFLKKHFPEIYRVLVAKRDKYMSEAIKELTRKYNKILVVVGAGHVEGLKKLLKNEELKIIW